MAMTSPRPSPTTMASASRPLDLEVTVVSGKHLKNVNWRHGDLKPYAVAYLDPDRRSATKPDDAGGQRPIWNERLLLPLPAFPGAGGDPSLLLLTLDVFHSKPSETPKPLVGTARAPVADLIDIDTFVSGGGCEATPIRTLELRRPSGRPQGKIRIRLAIRERPAPPPPEPSYQFAPPPAGFYYSTAPPPPPREYHRTYTSPSPPPLPPYAHHPPPPQPSQYPYGNYSDPYSGYFSSTTTATAAAGYYSAPPMPVTSRSYCDRPASGYGGPSAPLDYSSVAPSSSYVQRAKGARMGMGTGLAVGAVAGALGGLALEEGLKYEEDRIADRVESDLTARDDYSDYRADY